jgi:hypothetical protein
MGELVEHRCLINIHCRVQFPDTVLFWSFMKDYTNIVSYVSNLIKQEKHSIARNTSNIENIINSSIDAYFDMRDLKLTSVEDFNKLFILLEKYSQSLIDMVNDYINDPTTSDSFKSILYNFRDLHADVLASLIIMRTDITEINDHI